MNKAPDIHQRLDELETHVTHQDSIIDDLNEVSLQQWAEIKKLNEQIEFLKGKIEAAQEAMDSDDSPEPPPPHY